ncbi:MAG TPA: ferredoxin family protein, partial [Marmoricola sp.]|nr:ferredoxin family protein [Marmoricola sp.]
YIHPDECVDCGACEPVCPVEAIFYEDDLPVPWAAHLADNDAFFVQPVACHDRGLGSPGGAAKIGPVTVDAPLVAAMPRRRVGEEA